MHQSLFFPTPAEIAEIRKSAATKQALGNHGEYYCKVQTMQGYLALAVILDDPREQVNSENVHIYIAETRLDLDSTIQQDRSRSK